MERVNLLDMYDTPSFYQPPPDDQLATNTEYPNLNSRDYQTRPRLESSRSCKFFEQLAVNAQDNAILVANRYTDRVWHSHVWGFRRPDDVHDGVLDAVEPVAAGEAAADGVLFRLRCKATVSGTVHYVEENMILLGDTAGTLALWSTHSAARSPPPPPTPSPTSNGRTGTANKAPAIAYCLFKVGEQSEHTGAITATSLVPQRGSQALTGSSDGCIKCWDMGDGDLYSTDTYRAAHSRDITAICASAADAELFASCSLDRSVQLWDRRVPRPIVAVADGASAVGCTAMAWGEQLLVGDEAGLVHALDARQLGGGKVVRTWRPFRRDESGRVHRLRLDAAQQRLAVVADGRVVKVLDMRVAQKSGDGGGGEGDADGDGGVVFATPPAADFVRDAHWTAGDEQLLTVGWGAAMTRHSLAAMAAAVE